MHRRGYQKSSSEPGHSLTFDFPTIETVRKYFATAAWKTKIPVIIVKHAPQGSLNHLFIHPFEDIHCQIPHIRDKAMIKVSDIPGFRKLLLA